MLNTTYIYYTPEEIFKNIKFLKNFSIIEYSILLILILGLIIIITYILPSLYTYKEKYIKLKLKKKKKLLLKQILMQKELEDEILKEIKKYS